MNSLFLSVIFILVSLPAYAGNYLTDEKKEIIGQIQASIFNDDFESARQKSGSLISLERNDPTGYLFKAACYLAEMTDAEANSYQNEFKNLIDTVLMMAGDKSKFSDSTVVSYMYLWEGHAYAYNSLWESRFGSFTSALKQGLNAKNAYEKGLAYDSSNYDLYGGIGMYHYWKSAKTGFLRWLGIFKNDKQLGIDEMYKTIDSSAISKQTARNALIWIYFDKKDYDSVINITREMLGVYPEGKMFLWPLAQAYEKKREYQKAGEIYEQLHDKLLSRPGNYYNLIECDFNYYRVLKEQKDKNRQDDLLDDFVSYHAEIPKDIEWEQRSKIAYLKRAVKR